MIQLLGLGADPTPPTSALSQEIDGFLLRSPQPSSADVANFLKLYSVGDQRNAAAQALIARGVSAATISAALTFLSTTGKLTKNSILGVLSMASAAASGYHGFKRNHGSFGWGLWWFTMGAIFPIFTPVVALARSPGFAKPLPK
jgi:hypothetical protein